MSAHWIIFFREFSCLIGLGVIKNASESGWDSTVDKHSIVYQEITKTTCAYGLINENFNKICITCTYCTKNDETFIGGEGAPSILTKFIGGEGAPSISHGAQKTICDRLWIMK